MSQSTIYDQAAKAVVKMLETAGTDWCQPWQVNGSRNVVTDKLYRGDNTLILGVDPLPLRHMGYIQAMETFRSFGLQRTEVYWYSLLQTHYQRNCTSGRSYGREELYGDTVL